jgi:hypothetical protein
MEDIAEIMESQFVFYTPIFMYNVLISDSLRSPTVQLPFQAMGRRAYRLILGRARLYLESGQIQAQGPLRR